MTESFDWQNIDDLEATIRQLDLDQINSLLTSKGLPVEVFEVLNKEITRRCQEMGLHIDENGIAKDLLITVKEVPLVNVDFRKMSFKDAQT